MLLCARVPHRRYFVIVLLDLIECEERKTLTGLLRVISESVSLSGLFRFLNKWPWSTAALVHRWWTYFRERMTDEFLPSKRNILLSDPPAFSGEDRNGFTDSHGFSRPSLTISRDP